MVANSLQNLIQVVLHLSLGSRDMNKALLELLNVLSLLLQEGVPAALLR